MVRDVRLAWYGVWCVLALWAAWLVWCMATIGPSQDEIITLGNMVNVDFQWPLMATVAEHQQVFASPTAGYGAIAPMLIETDVHPPVFYYMLLTVAKFFGPNLWILRLSSLAWTAAAMVVVVREVGRMSPGTWAPFWAMLLMALSPAVAYAGLSARSYGLLFFEMAVFFAAAMALLRQPTRPWGPAGVLAVTGLLGVWTHYFAPFLIAPVALYLLVWSWRAGWPARLAVWGVAGVGLVGTLFLVPWLDVHMGARDHQYAGFKGALEVLGFARTIVEQLVFLPRSGWALGVLAVVLVAMYGVVRAALCTGRGHADFRLSVWVCVFGFAAMAALFWHTDKSFLLAETRYGIVLLAPMLVLVAFAVRRKSGIWAVAVVALCAVPTWVVRGGPGYEPWISDAYYARPAAFLDRPEHMVIIFNGPGHGGTVGGLVWRATAGHIGVPTSTAEASALAEAVPAHISAVYAVLYKGVLEEGESKKAWAALAEGLKAQGFTASASNPALFTRAVPGS